MPVPEFVVSLSTTLCAWSSAYRTCTTQMLDIIVLYVDISRGEARIEDSIETRTRAEAFSFAIPFRAPIFNTALVRLFPVNNLLLPHLHKILTFGLPITSFESNSFFPPPPVLAPKTLFLKHVYILHTSIRNESARQCCP